MKAKLEYPKNISSGSYHEYIYNHAYNNRFIWQKSIDEAIPDKRKHVAKKKKKRSKPKAKTVPMILPSSRVEAVE